MKGAVFHGGGIVEFIRFVALLVLCSLAIGLVSHVQTVDLGQQLLQAAVLHEKEI